MPLSKRIIPCLDVDNGLVVKGIHFSDVKTAGDPVKMAEKYTEQGADELVFLDITASQEGRRTIRDVVRNVASVVNIPFTVGGGIRNLEDAREILRSGADKVSVNTAGSQESSTSNTINGDIWQAVRCSGNRREMEISKTRNKRREPKILE